MKLTINPVLAANNGLDSARAAKKAHEILTKHDLRQPVLFHFVLTGSESTATYQGFIKALVRRLRNAGSRTEYFGAYEVQPLKGLHAHCFLLIETAKYFPHKILKITDGEYLHKLSVKHGINRPHIAAPQNPIHEGQLFARPVAEGGKLADCLVWSAYPYKQRSKYGVPGRETYFNSEFRANSVKRAAVLAALVAPTTKKEQA